MFVFQDVYSMVMKLPLNTSFLTKVHRSIHSIAVKKSNSINNRKQTKDIQIVPFDITKSFAWEMNDFLFRNI